MKKKNKKITGPEELLLDIKELLISARFNGKVKDFCTIEKHDIHHYNEISYINRKTKDKYHFPEPVILGYFFLKMIFMPST